MAYDILDRVPHLKLKIHNILDAGAATVSEVEQEEEEEITKQGLIIQMSVGFFSVQWWTVSKILIMIITIHHFQNPLKVK